MGKKEEKRRDADLKNVSAAWKLLCHSWAILTDRASPQSQRRRLLSQGRCPLSWPVAYSSCCDIILLSHALLSIKKDWHINSWKQPFPWTNNILQQIKQEKQMISFSVLPDFLEEEHSKKNYGKSSWTYIQTWLKLNSVCPFQGKSSSAVQCEL